MERQLMAGGLAIDQQGAARVFHTSNPSGFPPDEIGRDHARMTKAENRAAAKAYQEEKHRKWREEAHAAAVAADLEQLAALRKYLIFDKKAGIPAQDLISAIDDYAEKLTGDRRALHAQGHSIG
jgi:sRNA-binding protein